MKMPFSTAKKGRAVFLLLLAAQLALLALLGFMIFRRDRHPIVIEPSRDSWFSGTVQAFPAEGDMTISRENLLADYDALAAQPVTAGRRPGTIRAFIGLVGDLSRSGYTVTAEYSCDEEQSIAFDCLEPEALLSGNGRLAPGAHRTASFELWAALPVHAFRILPEYNGSGSLTLHRVTLQTNSALQRMELTLLLLLFLLADLGWCFRRQLKAHRLTVAALAGMILLTTLPVTIGFLPLGHDLSYHLLRIENVYEGLLRGEFPVRTAPIFDAGLGDASPLFYCDLLLMVPALLRLMGFPVAAAYGGYVLFINTVTVLIAFCCFRRMFRHQGTILLTTFLWSGSAYRFSNLLFRAAVGEYSAMAFLPLIALAFLRIADPEDRHTILQNGALMACGMAMLLMTHILSVEMVCLVLAVLFLMRLRAMLKPKALLTWVTAVLLTVLLSAWFLVPFLQSWLTLPISVAQPASAGTWLIQGNGANLADLFDFFKNAYVTNRGWPIRHLLMTPGAPLMAVMIAAVLLLTGKAERRERHLTFMALILLFISSDLFPWDLIGAYTPLGPVLCMVQLPWRYLTIACLVLTMLGGSLADRLSDHDPRQAMKASSALAAVCAVMLCFYTGTAVDHAASLEVTCGRDLDTALMTVSAGEYARVLPEEGSSRYAGYGVREPARGHAETTVLSRDAGKLVLLASADEASTLDFPRVHVPGLIVTDQSGNRYAVTDSEECLSRVVIPAGFSGELTLSFEAPALWRAAEMASAITLLLLILWLSFRRKETAP